MEPKEVKDPKIVIIGAGPSGLGAAYRLKELGYDNFIVIEADPEVGGLASSIVDPAGFTWDLGGHVVFSHYEYFDKMLDTVIPADEWMYHIREAWVWMRSKFIPYPLQSNIHRLPEEEFHRCLYGLIKKKFTAKKALTFADWLTNSFGEELCKTFMFPYNAKVWGFPATEMNVEWMGERVATVDTDEIVKASIKDEDSIGWGPNSKFRFPLHGGTGQIWKSAAKHIGYDKIKLETSVARIDTRSKTLRTSTGEEIQYDRLISTMPLDSLCKTLDDEKFVPEAAKFKYSSTHVIGLGLKGSAPKHLSTKCWLYFPEDDCPFYRVTVFSNYSPYNVAEPGKQWSLMFEVCESPYRKVDPTTIVEEVIRGALNTKLITEDDEIVSKFHTRLPKGYPTPFVGRDEVSDPILKSLEEMDIYSRGRFGAWKYEISNQDHTFMQGVEIVNRIVSSERESTLRLKEVVEA